MKILITPNYAAPYDRRMVDGLAAGFRQIGESARARAAPVDPQALAGLVDEYRADVVIQVNRTRDRAFPLRRGVRHVSWFQDVFPETLVGFADNFEPTDILYALGDPAVLGLDVELPCRVGSLVSGVDPAIFDYRAGDPGPAVDFSLCGFIPPPLSRHRSLIRRLLLNSRRRETPDLFVASVLEHYRPLSGELDIHRVAETIRSRVRSSHRFWAYSLRVQDLVSRQLERLSPLDRAISYFTREYPRQLDRIALIDAVLEVSGSLELYGPGWDRYARYRPYHGGVIDSVEGLLDVYLRSRINLANNTHGLGLHSRNLECMAVGGFVFMHESPHDDKPGGMRTSFEPGVHYGSYTPDTIAEQAMKWLGAEKARRAAGLAAQAVVREQHCWHHRARQIMEDLGN